MENITSTVDSSSEVYDSGFQYYISFVILFSYAVISTPLAFIYVRISKCHLWKFYSIKVLVVASIIFVMWFLPEIILIFAYEPNPTAALKRYLKYNLTSYLLVFAIFMSTMILYYHVGLYCHKRLSKTTFYKCDMIEQEPDPIIRELCLVGITVMCTIVYTIFYLKDQHENSPYLLAFFIPDIGFYTGRTVILYFIAKVTEKYDDLNKNPPPPDSTFEARNIFQDLDKHIIEQMITGVAQILLAIIYLIRLSGPDLNYSDSNASFYITGVISTLAYSINKDQFLRLNDWISFWAQVFHAEKEASVWTRIRRLLCLYLDVTVNVNFSIIIFILLPYQVCVDDGSDGVSFVLNLVAIFYVIELDDLKENKRFEREKIESSTLPSLCQDD